MSKLKLISIFHLPQFDRQVWILSIGRLLSQTGNGFTLFYAPIFFVNQVGIPATAVGLALGMGSIAGVVGRFLGGTLADTPSFGRKKTLILSAAISALADLVLVFTNNLPLLLFGNICMGLGIGLYWPATEAIVADLTTPIQRNEAFAITRLADMAGLSLGVVLGGLLISTTGNYRALFAIDGISFVIFIAVIYFAVTNNQSKSHHQKISLIASWGIALKDRIFLIFLLVNILFTTYLAHINSIMPLYFTNFAGLSQYAISFLFSFHIVLAALLQMPVARFLNRFSRTRALTFSMLFWGLGFIMVWFTGSVQTGSFVWAILAMTILAIATISYTPAATSLVVELAPEQSRGVYLSLNSQCWAIGYFISPVLGGWVLERSLALRLPQSALFPAQGSHFLINTFWLINTLSVILGIGVLMYLGKKMRHPKQT